MLNLVPFRRARRKMAHMNLNAGTLCQLAQLIFPQPSTITVTVPAVASNQYFFCVRESLFSYYVQPTGDALYSKFRSIVACPDVNEADVVVEVVDSVWRDLSEFF